VKDKDFEHEMKQEVQLTFVDHVCDRIWL